MERDIINYWFGYGICSSHDVINKENMNNFPIDDDCNREIDFCGKCAKEKETACKIYYI